MLPADLSDTVVVFDLDDTLYPEAAYVRSGIRAVCARLQALYGHDLTDRLLAVWEEGGDLWAEACRLLDLPPTAKDEMLWTYRLHEPDIVLAPEIAALIARLSERCRGLAILTDGRSSTQRLKLKALGLAHVPAFISGETGTAKPSAAAFENIARRHPAAGYVYIADNPLKDFVGANGLGWHTIGLTARDGQIHRCDVASLDSSYLPGAWIDSLADLAIP